MKSVESPGPELSRCKLYFGQGKPGSFCQCVEGTLVIKLYLTSGGKKKSPLLILLDISKVLKRKKKIFAM